MTATPVSESAARSLLVARFRSDAEFLERYLDAFEHGGLFLPTRRSIEAGTPVLVDVRMPALKDHLVMPGAIAWHRRGRRSQSIRAGLGVAFEAGDHAKRDYLLSLARGETKAAQRRHRRLPIQYPVGWRIPNRVDRHESWVGDIGAGGAFIRTPAVAPEGTSVVLELVPPGALAPQIIEGRVAWASATPGSEGLGVEFRCRDIGGMRRLRELVRRIRDQGLASATPE